MFLKIGRGITPLKAGPIMDSASKIAAVFGDSISFANIITSGGTQRTYESVGYLVCYNALSRQRMNLPNANNQGVSGNTTVDMLARKTDLAALTFDVCFIMAGTNDIVAKTPAATIIANLKTLYDYIGLTLGKKIVAMTILPRSYWMTLTPTEITAAKADIRTVNAWIMAQHDSRNKRLIAVNLYNSFNNGVDEPYTDATYDGLHPSPYGGMLNGMDLYKRLAPFFGNFKDPNFATGNLLANGNLTGTTGGVGLNFTGNVATSFTASGTGGTAGRTASKNSDGSQRLTMSLTGATNNDNARLAQTITTGFAVGDTLYGMALVQIIGTPVNIYGNSLQLRLSGTGIPTLNLTAGLDKRNNDNWLPEKYITVIPGKYLIQTPDFPITSGSSMSLEWRFEMLGNSTVGATSGTVDVFGAGLYKR